MKKFITLLLSSAFFSFTVKTAKIVTPVLIASSVHAQNYSTAGINPDFSYEVFKTNEPTNTFGNRKVVLRISSDFKYNFVRNRGLFIDSILHWPNPTVTSSARIAWINTSTKQILFSHVDSVAKQIDFNKLKNKPDLSVKQNQLNGTGFVVMTGTVPSYDNTSYYPASNPNGYISSYQQTTLTGAGAATVAGSFPDYTVSVAAFSQSFQPETDPTVSAAAKTISPSDVSNWNSKLSAEVDGSTSNEIQALSINGNTVSLSVGGGSFVIPTQTTALTASQVTDALGTQPLFTEIDGSTTNEIQSISINGNTVSLTSGGQVTLPTQTVATTIANGTGISIAGAHPNWTVTNTIPDQTVSLTPANGLTVTGTYPTFTITQKRQETYSGTTAANGTYTVSFAQAYSVAPNIQAAWIGASDSNNLRVTAISTTGFTVLARNRVDVVGLLPSWNNVSGATIDVLITEK